VAAVGQRHLVADVRYLDALALQDGTWRLFYVDPWRRM
jgi:hypothetical protein